MKLLVFPVSESSMVRLLDTLVVPVPETVPPEIMRSLVVTSALATNFPPIRAEEKAEGAWRVSDPESVISKTERETEAEIMLVPLTNKAPCNV